MARIASAGLALTTVMTLSAQPASAVGDDPGVMIIGGNDATQDYPFAARLLTTYAGLGVARCTGTFVTEHRTQHHVAADRHDDEIGVATNAHCVSDLVTGAAMPASTVQVQAGSTKLDQLTTLQATGVEVYPTWDWGTGDDPFADVAVVNVTIPAGLHVRAIPLADWVRVNQEVRLLGWGMTVYGASEPPAVLQQLDTRLTARSACAAAGITAGELCVAPAANGGQACFGDSGGPALDRHGRSWVVLGGASRGTDESTCTGPLVYTDFMYYSRWIGRQLAGEHTSRSPRYVDPRAARRFWALAG